MKMIKILGGLVAVVVIAVVLVTVLALQNLDKLIKLGVEEVGAPGDRDRCQIESGQGRYN